MLLAKQTMTKTMYKCRMNKVCVFQVVFVMIGLKVSKSKLRTVSV